MVNQTSTADALDASIAQAKACVVAIHCALTDRANPDLDHLSDAVLNDLAWTASDLLDRAQGLMRT